MCVCVHTHAQSCLTLCDPMDYRPQDSSVHGISQARIPECVAIFLLQLVIAKGMWDRGGKDWEFGISRCKLLHTGWINNKAYCIAQGAIFNILLETIVEKNMKRIYVYNNNFAVQQKLTQHCESTIFQQNLNICVYALL